MKRVQADIDEMVRGLAARYKDKYNLTMPQAYGMLIRGGLSASDISTDGVISEEDLDGISFIDEEEYYELLNEVNGDVSSAVDSVKNE